MALTVLYVPYDCLIYIYLWTVLHDCLICGWGTSGSRGRRACQRDAPWLSDQLALAVLYVAWTVLYLALTVLDMALTALNTGRGTHRR